MKFCLRLVLTGVLRFPITHALILCLNSAVVFSPWQGKCFSPIHESQPSSLAVDLTSTASHLVSTLFSVIIPVSSLFLREPFFLFLTGSSLPLHIMFYRESQRCAVKWAVVPTDLMQPKGCSLNITEDRIQQHEHERKFYFCYSL